METGNPFTVRLFVEPKPQTIWGLSHATWFYAMGVGGALFLNRTVFGIELGRLFGLSLAHLLSFVLIGIGGLILIADLGRPARFWRALRNVRSSWIAVGAVADFVFLFLELLYILPDLEVGGGRPLSGLPWAGVAGLEVPILSVSGAAAFLVIIYPGLVLSSSPAIPFWQSMLIPLQYLLFAHVSALGLSLLFAPANGGFAGIPSVLLAAEGLLVFLCLALFVAHLLNAYSQRGTARESARLLLRGRLGLAFLGGSLAAGLALPLILTLLASLTPETALRAGLLIPAGALSQVGNFLSKYTVIKAGVYPPLL